MIFQLKQPQILKDLVAALRQWNEDDGSMLAASVAYYGALSFFPLILILLALFGFVLRFSDTAQDAQQELLDLLAENISPIVADTVASLLQNVQGSAKLGGPAGLFLLLFTAIGIFHGFEAAFDRVWNLPRKTQSVGAAVREALFERFRAFLMMLAAGGLLVLEFISGVVQSVLANHLPAFQQIPFFWRLVQNCGSLAISVGAFTLLYKTLTKVAVRWGEAARGGLLTGISWEIGRQVLSYLVIGKQFSVYGVVGSFIGLMLWIYVACCIIFFGAEYLQVICERCVDRPQAKKARPPRWVPA